jgi:outer membrane biogenesis lipoprotein LolB
MNQAVKATVLVFLVFLLSGCSSSTSPADKPQAKTECEIVMEKAAEKARLLTESNQVDYGFRGRVGLLYYIVEESDCFNSEIVSEAKAGIAVILKQ